MSTMIYFVGHPTRITRGKECPTDLELLQGLFKGRILPPINLPIPVFHLVFNLCDILTNDLLQSCRF